MAPNVRFKFIVADDQSIYAVKGSSPGYLFWYQYQPSAVDWTQGSGSPIGVGWDKFVHVFTGGNGIIYAVCPNGDLFWYQDVFRNGANGPNGDRGWKANSGAQIGSGWHKFVHVFSGGDGIIYAIDQDGYLFWFKDSCQNGTNGQAGLLANSGRQVGRGWESFVHVFSGGDGILYAVRPNGDVFWYQDSIRDGSNGEDGLSGNDGRQIHAGWNQFVHLSSAGNGLIYGIRIEEKGARLVWYQDMARDGTNGSHGEQGWDDDSAPEGATGSVAQRIDRLQTAPIEGYCWPLSAEPGQTIDFFLSTVTEHVYSVTYVRLKQLPSGDFGCRVGAPVPFKGRYQPSSDQSWTEGCGWEVSFPLTIPKDWNSGLYAAKCQTVAGATYFVVFVVKSDAGKANSLLVLANTNTWNAYNTWGGNSNYSFNDPKRLSFERPNLHLLNCPKDADWGNHLVRSEIWLLDWLDENNYKYDMVTDTDLHQGIGDYRTLILSTHPEYWSVDMQDHLLAHLDRGGKGLVYLGGDAMYRIVVFESDYRAFNTSSYGSGELFRNQGRGERKILGVAYFASYPETRPYVVEKAQRGHWVFHDVQFQAGGEIGRTGSGAGWECDAVCPDQYMPAAGCQTDQSPAGTVVLARRKHSHEGCMAFRDLGNRGFVFSAGSIRFVWSLLEDDALQTIVKNVLNR